MKPFKSFRGPDIGIQESKETKIAITQKFEVLRDGGSPSHTVLNPDECGFVLVIQDFSIHAKKQQTEGQFFGMLPPPNHLSIQWVKLLPESLDWR